jgi:glycosyltransferase involved in cell wall biosynthesis
MMVAYNAEPIIKAAIESTYDYVDEIIVVDGSADGPSTDNTAVVAQSVGEKVTLLSGTFIAKDGSWGEKKQRQVAMDMCEKDFNNWIILQDADEVYDDAQIKQLLKYMESAPINTMMFSVGGINFWRDTDHYMVGGCWSTPRSCGAWRLIPQALQLGYNTVGTIRDDGSLDNWRTAKEPKKIILPLDEVFFYHYGHVVSFERAAFKQRHFVEQGLCKREGFEKDEWERYLKEEFIPLWNKKTNIPDCKFFNGKHPVEVEPYLNELQSVWLEQ